MQGTLAVRIDQVLHGYDRGHKELAASIALDERSRAEMLVRSDLLAATDLEEGASYLTAYPLQTASKHVLARTWAAGRGYRPGSVWTHSLILDYQALALIPDLVALRSLFKDPNLAPPNDFAEHVTFSITERSHVSVEKGSRAAGALMQIYGDIPMQDIVVRWGNGELDEILALALWRQMWPGLRREFAFFTGVANRPAGFDSGCALRFSHDARDGAEHWTGGSLDSGHRVLLDDLPKSGPTALRTFLGRYVIESKQPRRLAVRLATLQGEKKSAPLDQRLRDIRSLIRDEPLPRLVRDVLVEELDSALSIHDMIALVRAFRNEAIEMDLSGKLTLAGAMSDHEFRDLLAATQPSNEDEFGGRLFANLIRMFRLETVASAADGRNRLMMLRLRPEVATVRAYWPKDDHDRADLITQIDGLIALDLDKGMVIFGTSMGGRTVATLLRLTPDDVPTATAALLVTGDQEVRDILAAWIVQTPRRLASFASRPEAAIHDVVEMLARAQIQVGVPITGASSWAMLVGAASREANRPPGNAALVVGYITALGLDHDGSLTLAGAVYDHLQRAVRHSRLSVEEARYLESGLPAHCRTFSLANSLTRSAVRRWPLGANNSSALAISRDPEYLRELVSETAARHGRRRLEEVLKNGRLSVDANDCVKRFLEQTGTKPRLFWW